MAVGAVITFAVQANGSSDSKAEPSATATATVVPTTPMPTLVVSPTPLTFTDTPPPDLQGFAYPIDGACLPESDDLMPGAPRPYRYGTHEGVDFYDSDNCAFLGIDTEILAAKAGTIVRAELDYTDLTLEEIEALLARAQESGGADPAVEDAFRGRQVWIDHGDGVVTRYAHLNGIADGIDVGVEVAQGELIGYMGESGAPESVTDPGTQVHLHFEIRVGDFYLGQGLAPEDVRLEYEAVFSE